MGQAVDDASDGTVCQECGTFFDDILSGKPPPGHPRTCSYCKREHVREDPYDDEEADEEELFFHSLPDEDEDDEDYEEL